MRARSRVAKLQGLGGRLAGFCARSRSDPAAGWRPYPAWAASRGLHVEGLHPRPLRSVLGPARVYTCLHRDGQASIPAHTGTGKGLHHPRGQAIGALGPLSEPRHAVLCHWVCWGPVEQSRSSQTRLQTLRIRASLL